MATSKEYKEFILEQLSLLDNITCKPMMGEFLLYYNNVLFERTDKLKFKYTLYGMVPTAVYGIYYLINVLTHIENGTVSTTYDWYWFVQNGLWTAVIVVPLIFNITYVISLIIWKLNRIKN